MTAITWIDVRDRLPNEGQRVLIWTNEDHVFGYHDRLENLHVATFRIDAIQGNNLVPYVWRGDGPMQWFGQDVYKWAELPETANVSKLRPAWSAPVPGERKEQR